MRTCVRVVDQSKGRNRGDEDRRGGDRARASQCSARSSSTLAMTWRSRSATASSECSASGAVSTRAARSSRFSCRARGFRQRLATSAAATPQDEIDLVAVYCRDLDRCYLLPDLARGRATRDPSEGHAAAKWSAGMSEPCGRFRVPRGCSSAGRALEWHSRGQGFESPQLHLTTGNAPRRRAPVPQPLRLLPRARRRRQRGPRQPPRTTVRPRELRGAAASGRMI